MINMSFGTLELNFGEQLKEGNSLKTSKVVNSTKLAELISDKAKIGQKSTKNGHMYSEQSYDLPNYRLLRLGNMNGPTIRESGLQTFRKIKNPYHVPISGPVRIAGHRLSLVRGPDFGLRFFGPCRGMAFGQVNEKHFNTLYNPI